MTIEDRDKSGVSDGKPPKLIGATNLFRNTGFIFAADLLFALGRALTFFLLGIAMGVDQLGQYAAVLGLTQLIFPASRWGIAHIMVRNVTRGEPFAAGWSKVVSVNVLGGLLGSAVSVAASAILFDVSLRTTFLIGLSQLIGLGVQQAGGMAAAAHGRAQIGLLINAINTTLRVGAILIFFYAVSTQTIDVWAYFLVTTMLAGAVTTLTVIRTTLGGRIRFALPTRLDLRMGAGFVFVDSANSAQADLDKVVLGGFGLDADTGVYAAAYRVADLASLPLGALVRASYSEFFRRGSKTIAEAVRYARKLTIASVSYGLVAGVLLWVTAPLLEVLMGSQFEDSVTVLRWIAFVPAIRAAQFFPANVLTGSDRQWVRARLMTGTASLNLVMNIILVPRHGWRGAAVTTMISEAVFTLLLWMAVNRALRAEQVANYDNAG
ncbi:MAG: O-antigen/teichoic acid export membrane protein [Verrucomicrobiales bacterium]